jgi:hypothetical protein
MATDRKPYKPQPFSGESIEAVRNYLDIEINNIAKAFMMTMLNPLTELHVAPTKLFTGLTVLADGTDWDPGAGQGVYTYYAAAWHKLG